MGTNFYASNPEHFEEGSYDEYSPVIHIGKRSAAGPYCFDCGITLCKLGVAYLHYSIRSLLAIEGVNLPWAPEDYDEDHGSHFFKECPICGKTREEEDLSNSAGGRELGFNKEPQVPAGVRSCCSFSWAMDPHIFKANKPKKVWDEYGEEYSIEEFQKDLDSYPIHYMHSVGKEFC